MNPHRRERPARPQPELHFCAICQVSIAAAEIESGMARRTPRGRTFCGICATATPDERNHRREMLEREFADDAPVPVPAPISGRRVAPAAPAAASPPDDPVVVLRVNELERAAFRLQARVTTLEEKLEAALHRLG